MIRMCYSEFHIGERKFGEKKPLKDKSETHGLCDRCFELEMKRLGKRKLEAVLCQRELSECVDCMECWSDRD